MNNFLHANAKVLSLTFLGLFVVLYHFIGFQTHYGVDDIMYARLAKDLMDGKLLLEDYHFTYRWSILAPTALAYTLFGINDLASALPPIAITLFTLYLIYIATRNQSRLIVLLALSLFILTGWTLFYSDKLMPDIYATLGCLAAVIVIYKHRYGSLKNPLLAAICFTLAIFFGFLAKASIVLLIPVIGFIFLSDIMQRKHVRFWGYTISVMLLTLIVYLAIIYHLTGSAFNRVMAIKAGGFYGMSTYAERPISDLMERLTYGLPVLFTKHVFITALMFSIPPLLNSPFKRILRLDDSKLFYPVVIGLAYLSANFMSTSYDHFIPMLAEPRHFLFLIPFAAITAAPVLYTYFTNLEYKKSVLAISIIVAGTAIAIGDTLSIYTYVSILLIVSTRYVLPLIQRRTVVRSFVFAFVAIMFMRPIYDIRIGYESNYKSQKLMIKNHLLDLNSKAIVITNSVQKGFGEYYQGFEEEGKARWIRYRQEADYKFQPDDDIYVLVNSSTRGLSALNYFDVPLYARRIPSNFDTIHDEKGLGLYRVKNSSDLVREELILNDFNDFEIQHERWSDYRENLSEEYYFSEKVSNYAPAQGFSAHYSLPISDLLKKGTERRVHMVCRIKIRSSEVSNIELVLEAKDGSKTTLWSSARGETFEALKDNWWQAVKHEELDLNVLSSSAFSIVVWNRSDKPIYIDDFEIEVFN